MTNLVFSLFFVLALIVQTNISAQEYDPGTGITLYPNGTIYRPAHHGENQSDSDIVTKISAKKNPEGGNDFIKTIIICEDEPDACKAALEEAADDAASREGGTNNIKDGCGTLDDWLNNPGNWPTLPPIIYMDDRVPGLPIPPRNIETHTSQIIHQIR